MLVWYEWKKNFKIKIWNDDNNIEIWFVNNSSISLYLWNNM